MENKSVEQSKDRVIENWGNPNTLVHELPSAFQLGDTVNLNFHRCGNLYGCHIIKVHFGVGKVLYDVELPVLSEPVHPQEEKMANWTRIYNIDSVFVEKPQPASN